MYNSGIKNPLQAYQIETIKVADGDVILLHLANDLNLDDINTIRKEIQQYFPNNQVICANDHILKKITVFQKEKNPFVEFNLEDLL